MLINMVHSSRMFVAIFFALGLMSKPQVITLPFVLLLWDYWPPQRLSFNPNPRVNVAPQGTIPAKSLPALIWEKVPLLGLCLASAVLTLTAQSSGGATSSYGFALRLENALVSYAQYLGKAIWPSRLALFYPYPAKPYPLFEVCGALLFCWRSRPWLSSLVNGAISRWDGFGSWERWCR